MSDEGANTGALFGAVAGRSYRLVRGMAGLYAGFAVLAIVLLTSPIWPVSGLHRLREIAIEAVAGGMAGIVLSGLALALTGLIATQLITASRQRVPSADGHDAEVETPDAGFVTQTLMQLGPGIVARQGQAIVVPFGAIIASLAAWLLWPATPVAAVPMASNAYVAAAIAIGMAFPSLVAERVLSAYPVPQMPEAPSLRRLLLVATLLLGAAGCFEIGRGLGLLWVRWPIEIVLALTAVITVELGLRALGRLFLPPPVPEQARAVTESVIVTLLTGGPRAPAILIRTHLGLDFARSWALAYLRAAILPAILTTLVLCWVLSGLKLINVDQRGVYERFGAPVAVLGPGLHLLLPWPLGRLRPVEYGRIHTVVVNTNYQPKVTELIGAESQPPPSMNRLWDTSHPSEAEYLVASQSSGQQEFQAVSAEIRVLYRTGLTNEDALQSVYGAVSQNALVKTAADSLMTRYFASHTLDQVMGAKRDSLESYLRSTLSRSLRADHAGIEVVAVLVEAIHPPAGAAAAYHAVQAAQIKADTSISNETGRAERTMGVAQEEKRETLDNAKASATEKLDRAKSGAYTFVADRRASQLAPAAFLMERRFHDLQTALKGRALTILDNRLTPDQVPFIDLRPYGNTGTSSQSSSSSGGSSSSNSSQSQLPGVGSGLEGPGSGEITGNSFSFGQTVSESGNITSDLTPTAGASTESKPPPMTAEYANELAQDKQLQKDKKDSQ